MNLRLSEYKIRCPGRPRNTNSIRVMNRQKEQKGKKEERQYVGEAYTYVFQLDTCQAREGTFEPQPG